jgi:hypothetical protein
MTNTTLPNEILIKIFNYCNVIELMSIRKAYSLIDFIIESRIFNESDLICDNDNVFMSHLIKHDKTIYNIYLLSNYPKIQILKFDIFTEALTKFINLSLLN